MKDIKKWHIYRANLDPVIGSEQGKSRPVLVISEDDINELLNCVNVLLPIWYSKRVELGLFDFKIRPKKEKVS